MLQPQYTLEKLKFGVDSDTFKKAVDLYEAGKVKNVKEDSRGFSAIVHGSQKYFVSVHAKDFDRGMCECYLGQKDILCKHMIALALHAVQGGKKIKPEEIEVNGVALCSGKRGVLTKAELKQVNAEITKAFSCIKSYSGGSRTWFAYTHKLGEGATRLGDIFSRLPVSKQSSDLIIKTLLKLDKKLCDGGVDDSDGALGGCIYQSVEMLLEYVKLDPECAQSFEIFRKIKSNFGWEEKLIQ
ncbi:MAG: SWIM zinc finger family protein [Minisyncoccota bacterium]